MANISIRLKSYLDDLRIFEAERLPKRKRAIPSLQELADVAGIGKSGLSKIANNQVGKFDRKILAAIVKELRRRGFETDVADILIFVDDE